jgi:hypothetical protein
MTLAEEQLTIPRQHDHAAGHIMITWNLLPVDAEAKGADARWFVRQGSLLRGSRACSGRILGRWFDLGCGTDMSGS